MSIVSVSGCLLRDTVVAYASGSPGTMSGTFVLACLRMVCARMSDLSRIVGSLKSALQGGRKRGSCRLPRDQNLEI